MDFQSVLILFSELLKTSSKTGFLVIETELFDELVWLVERLEILGE